MQLCIGAKYYTLLQRNYNTVSKLLHERLQLLEEASQQLVAERSHVAECQSQLEVTISRAEEAEKQLQHGVHLPDQLQQLQQQVNALRTARDEEYQQRVALQEQLTRCGCGLSLAEPRNINRLAVCSCAQLVCAPHCTQ
jgi:chromosome segregation ATPase